MNLTNHNNPSSALRLFARAPICHDANKRDAYEGNQPSSSVRAQQARLFFTAWFSDPSNILGNAIGL
jgi:hypothetical protein